MKATEQLSSLEMMAVDPLRRIVAPRFWAGMLAMPMLAIIFSAIGISRLEPGCHKRRNKKPRVCLGCDVDCHI